MIAEVEGLGALLLTLQGCSDFVSASAAIILYVRRYFDSSITSQIVHYISDTFEPQSGETVSVPEWLTLIRNVRENWTLCKGNKLFAHFSKLLGLVVTLGLCKTSDVTFHLQDYKIFEPDLKIVHGSATDVADAAFSTVTFFVESMYMCFKQKSLKPFLIGDQQSAEIDEEYANVVLFWSLVKTGNLTKVKGVSDAEFDRRLEELTTRIRNLLNLKTSFEKKLLSDKFMKLLSIRNDYITQKISSGVRKAPFAIELFGESSQGKTTVGDQIVDALLSSAKLPLDKKYRASYNPSDKFMSTWTTDKLVMTVDDMSNDKSDFVERPPTRTIIDLCNNQPYYANMAELEKKGSVFVEPEIVIVSTNIRDLDARTYSNCPYSIQRRMHVVITVKAKREFQKVSSDGKTCGIDSKKVRAHYKETGIEPTFDDIWELTLSKAVKPQKLHHVAFYEVINWRNKNLQNISFQEALHYLIEQFHEHREDQDFIVNRMASRQTEIHLCGVDGCCQIKDYCLDHSELDKQFGEEIERALGKATNIVTSRVNRDVSYASACVEGAATFALINSAKYLVNNWDWMTFVPTSFLMNETFFSCFLLLNKNRLKRNYIRNSLIVWLSFLFVSVLLSKVFPLAIVIPFYIAFSYQRHMYDRTINMYRAQLLDRNSIAPAIQSVRDTYASQICGAVGVIGILYSLARIYRKWKNFKGQGSLEPKTPEDVQFRDSQVNPWTEVVKREIVLNESQLTTSYERLSAMVQKNLVYGTVRIGERKLMVNGLYLKSNVVVIPSHYFEADSLDVTFRKSNPDACGGKFAVRLSKNSSVRVPDSDLCLCYSSTGGSFKDLTNYLPESALGHFQFMMHYRQFSGEIKEIEGIATEKMTTNGVCHFMGGEYDNLAEPTFGGLCGATLVSAGRGNTIAGFHLGGKAGQRRGCYGRLLKLEAETALEELRKLPGVLLTGTAEQFEKQVLGVKVLTDRPMKVKSPLNYLPPDCQMEYYGSCPGETKYFSSVRVMPCSEAVMDIMDQPNIWGAPKFKPEWFGWQKCLENMSVPAHPYEYDVFSIAVEDYKSALIPIFQNNMWNDAKPLSDHHNLCGVPGVRFIDAIKLNTSIGFPLSGAKRKFVTELPPTEEQPNNRVLDEVIMTEIKRCEDCYRRGERAFPITKACKKDEILAKEKCRIFYANPIALTWLVRKYFLPLLRVLQMNPITSECAVGINSNGPEWNRFHKHITKYGVDSLIGGDYGKYDQKLPSQLIIGALRILIDLARECDYSKEDLDIMEAMAGDLAYALIAFNGDLIGLTEGSHISGNSLTAVLNGICGSINLRVYFYTMYKSTSFEERIPFRDAVALMTYGDDNIGSSKPEFDKFNIKGISEFLAKFGQTYTMPDKESELLAYLPPDQLEFLKCSSVYHPDLGCYLGALAEKSIFKSLHCYRDENEDLTPEKRTAESIDNASREFFCHGRSVYDARVKQLREVADVSGVSHLCKEVELSYDERCANWHDKYGEEVRKYDAQSGEELSEYQQLTMLPINELIHNTQFSDYVDEEEHSVASEDTAHVDLYFKAVTDIKLKLVARDKRIIVGTIGEIDLVFQMTVFGVNNFVYVEVKESVSRTTSARRHQRWKGKKQLSRIIEGLGIIAPKCHHIGIYLDDDGYTLVASSGAARTLPIDALPV